MVVIRFILSPVIFLFNALLNLLLVFLAGPISLFYKIENVRKGAFIAVGFFLIIFAPILLYLWVSGQFVQDISIAGIEDTKDIQASNSQNDAGDTVLGRTIGSIVGALSIVLFVPKEKKKPVLFAVISFAVILGIFFGLNEWMTMEDVNANS